MDLRLGITPTLMPHTYNRGHNFIKSLQVGIVSLVARRNLMGGIYYIFLTFFSFQDLRLPKQ
jgi:hypothetical protein